MIAGLQTNPVAPRRRFVPSFGDPALLSLAALLVAGPLSAAETGPDFTKLAVIPPGPDLVAAAEARKIPLSGRDPVGEPGQLNPGDSFTAMVTLGEKGKKRTQWLLYLLALPSGPGELPGKTNGPMVLYSGRSNRFEFVSSPAQVRLQTLGPFTGTSSKTAKVREQSATFTLDKGLLSLGLDKPAATVWRAIQAKESGTFYFGPSPPDAAQVAAACKTADRLQLTLEEERALGGGIPALFSYFDVVQHTEGLEDMLLKVVRKPSLWSVVRHVGVTVNLRFDVKHTAPAEPGSWASISDSAVYYFPLGVDLNGQPALRVTFAVTNPRPPLLSCGGIIGMLAEKPGDNETYLTLRIISARLAPRS